MPADAPPEWQVTFEQQVGDVLMFIRDTVPPGDRLSNHRLETINWDYIADWRTFPKNQGPYGWFDAPGTHRLTTPPLRPGSTYYLGFLAKNDATFSIATTTSGTPAAALGTIPFYGGQTNGVLAPHQRIDFQVPVPADGVRWRSQGEGHGLRWALEQGTVPRLDAAHYLVTEPFTLSLRLNYWPWLPETLWTVAVQNQTDEPQPFQFLMDGRDWITEDEDQDGLPDGWEEEIFGATWSQTGDDDSDGDGVSNWNEFLENTVPTDAASLRPRIIVQARDGGSVSRAPDAPSYALGTLVTLTASPDLGSAFVGWQGTISSLETPLVVAAHSNVTVTAVFNGAPVAADDSTERFVTSRVFKILMATLLANDSDPDGDLLTIVEVGDPRPAGATVSIQGDFVVYTASETVSAGGGFTYRLSDGYQLALGTVTVSETSDPADSPPNSVLTLVEGDDVKLSFLGVPGRTYGIQYRASLTFPLGWTEFSPPADLVAPPNGVFTYTDIAPVGESRFYRAVLRR